MFPKDCWYVAAIDREVQAGAVLCRTICEVPMALFRDQEGRIGALLDRCPHRLFPLSRGTVDAAGLRCAYHGLAFDTAGRCTAIPSQVEIPANARVAAFAVREAHGMIWVWPGNQEAAATTPLPAFPRGDGYLAGLDFSCLDPSGSWGIAGPECIHVDANYMLAVDNLLDLTHTAFVHAATFDNAGVLDSARTVKAMAGNQLIDFFGFKNRMSRPLRDAYILDERVELYDNFLETYWHPPGVMVLVHGAVPEGGDRERDGAIVLNTNIITPEREDSCHYFWAQSVYRNRGAGAVRDMWDVMTRTAFAEDVEVLQAQQANLERFGSTSLADDVSLVLKADKGIVLARRIVDRMIREEAAATVN